MATWRVGSATVHKVVEVEFPLPVAGALRTSDEGLLDRYPWLAPHYASPGGLFTMSFHALLVDTGDRRILIDTCIGNDRTHPIVPPLQTGWLDVLKDTGYPPETIDTVVCTHLHFDHVGWNTRLVDGAWVPTFPNARYLIPRAEWEFWRTGAESDGRAELADTVDPLLAADLVDFVEPGHRVADGITLEAAPGHTPGQVAVLIESAGPAGVERAVVTGDLVHHAVQFVAPEVGSPSDEDPAQATATRRAFVERYADTGTLVLGTHFPDPSAGYLTRADGELRFVVAQDG
ncbi:MBL fold metallo-hydrolase [Yinghuangia seranimata]|uniref:MBL fold metallo-hydrolase n=1 Tax=Yinghuangia seranimata TaxID=408067 RepID=UPI00248AE8A9|nr:MBL fold metallo-hydrolase [Yinghuangia seranimata]MDI2132096.1 MBL fold metallo-hydrolase [Yinghuangia seranimata]